MFNCSDVNYVIMGTNNCGSCINTTIKDSTATCTNMSIDGHVCSLTIQTEIKNCDVLNKTISDAINIPLKGIDDTMAFCIHMCMELLMFHIAYTKTVVNYIYIVIITQHYNWLR